MILSLVLMVSLQAPADVQALLNRAYQHLRDKNYETAVELFQQAVALDPAEVRAHRELGFTYRKMGEPEKAADAFAAYAKARPDDCENRLDLAYAYAETKREALAMESFRRVQELGTPPQVEQARQAFRAVEQPLLDEIARWTRAIKADAGNLDAREALADAYRRHGDREQAIAQFQELRVRVPQRTHHLLTLAALFSGRPEANAYYLLAWRSADPRVAAAGREGLKDRYPYGPEFERALQLEPWQNAVRKELGYLYLQLNRPKDALPHFEWLAKHDPQDAQCVRQLEDLRVTLGLAPETAAQQARRHRELGYASLAKSYLPAAAAEFEAVHRLEPGDDEAVLQLGYIYNQLKRDDEALRWFRLAAAGSNAAVARKARVAVHNLTQANRKVITTVWAMPFWSSRFDSAFGYGQIKTEWKNPRLPFRPYLSVRMIGDSRTRTGGANPRILSDDGVVVAAGLQARLARNLYAWGEAGNAVSGLGERPRGLQRSEPDYRGGLAFAKTWGPGLFQNEPGRFVETTLDAVYLSRFGHNAIGYAQTKAGYQLPKIRGVFQQPFLAVNLVHDVRGDYFNHLLEVGPGYRVGLEKFNRFSVYLTSLRGIYTSKGSRMQLTGRPNYVDIRLVFWYARSF